MQEKSSEVSEKSTGCLRIEVSNLPEFKELIEQAKREADQLQETINRLRYFDLNINFEVKKQSEERNEEKNFGDYDSSSFDYVGFKRM